MKRLIPIFVLLITGSLFAFDDTKKPTLVGNVIRMSQAGVSDDTIIAFVMHMSEPFTVTGDDVVAMTNAHVSNAVIKAVVDEAARRERARRRAVAEENEPLPIYLHYYDPHWFMPRLYSPVSTPAAARLQAPNGDAARHSPLGSGRRAVR